MRSWLIQHFCSRVVLLAPVWTSLMLLQRQLKRHNPALIHSKDTMRKQNTVKLQYHEIAWIAVAFSIHLILLFYLFIYSCKWCFSSLKMYGIVVQWLLCWHDKVYKYTIRQNKGCITYCITSGLGVTYWRHYRVTINKIEITHWLFCWCLQQIFHFFLHCFDTLKWKDNSQTSVIKSTSYFLKIIHTCIAFICWKKSLQTSLLLGAIKQVLLLLVKWKMRQCTVCADLVRRGSCHTSGDQERTGTPCYLRRQ